MDRVNKKTAFIDMLKKDKKRLTLVITAVIGVLLMLFSLGAKESGGKGGEESESLAEYKRELEKELSELCSSVSGAGKCKVKVSFSEGERSEYRGTNKISETPPRVLGITIISEGGDKAEVKTALTECMTAMFDIRANRVAVLKMR